MNRRSFITYTFSAGLMGRSIYSVGPAVIATSCAGSARAEPITIAIAVVSAVAGMIASHNRGDGGLGAMLSAIDGKLAVIKDQLTSIQTALSLAVENLAKLPGEIDKILTEHEIERLNTAILAVSQTYEKLLDVRNGYKTDNDFIKATGVSQDISSSLERLEEATSELRARKAYGPTTAMVVPTALLLEYTLLLLRGDARQDIAARMKSSVSWFDNILNPGLPTSTAAYRTAAANRHNEFAALALQNVYGKALGMESGKDTVYACYGIDDYRKEYVIEKRCRTYSQSTNPLFIPAGFGWEPCPVTVPERMGVKERIFSTIKLTETEHFETIPFDGKDQKQSSGYKELQIVRNEPSPILDSNDPAVPPSCEVSTVDLEDAQLRAKSLKNSLTNSPHVTELENLDTIVANINLERARMSLATSAITISLKAKLTIYELIAELKK